MWWGAKLSKHLRPAAQPRSSVRLLPDDRGRSLRRNLVAQRNSQAHVCVLTSVLRNLDDPKEDFLAKQYRSKHNCLSVSVSVCPPYPQPFCVCVWEKWSFCWVAKCFQSKQASGSCSPAHLLSALQPLLWVGDLIAQAEVWSSPGGHAALRRGALSMPGKKKKQNRKKKG